MTFLYTILALSESIIDWESRSKEIKSDPTFYGNEVRDAYREKIVGGNMEASKKARLELKNLARLDPESYRLVVTETERNKLINHI